MSIARSSCCRRPPGRARYTTSKRPTRLLIAQSSDETTKRRGSPPSLLAQPTWSSSPTPRRSSICASSPSSQPAATRRSRSTASVSGYQWTVYDRVRGDSAQLAVDDRHAPHVDRRRRAWHDAVAHTGEAITYTVSPLDAPRSRRTRTPGTRVIPESEGKRDPNLKRLRWTSCTTYTAYRTLTRRSSRFRNLLQIQTRQYRTLP